jgi:RNA polymerase sigma-70 factor (ECF subfamily)
MALIDDIPDGEIESSERRSKSVEGGHAESHAESVVALFREHNRVLISFLRVRLRSEQDARECAQEAYVKLLQLDQPGAVTFLRSYLFRTAANLAVDRIRQREVRRRAERLEVLESADVMSAPPESSVMAAEELSFVKNCLQELPRFWREAFIRSRALGESEVSIAKSLGLSDRMVRNYLVQTRAYCHARLGGRTIRQARNRVQKMSGLKATF